MVGFAGRAGLLTDYLPSQDQIEAPTTEMARGIAQMGSELQTVIESGRGLAIR